MNGLNQLTESIQNSISNLIQKVKPMRHSSSMNNLNASGNPSNINQGNMRMSGVGLGGHRNQYRNANNLGSSFDLNNNPS